MISSEFIIAFLVAYAIIAYIPLWLGLFVVASLIMYRVIKVLLWFLFVYPVETWKTMVFGTIKAFSHKNEIEIKEDYEVEIKDE